MTAENTTFDGTYELLVPTGMFSVLDPPDRDGAVASFEALFREMFPSIVPSELDMLVDGMLRWRDLLLDLGVIFHGVVAMPAGFEYEGYTYGPAHWHVCAGVVEVPVHAELDAGALAARVLKDRYPAPGTHTESFETVMGWGAGVIAEIPVLPDDPVAPVHVDLPGQMAVAAVLSAEHGSDRGLLVLGLAVDPSQKHEMAAVVGLMAGRSTITPDVPKTPS